ncbi:MAG: membrane protein insertase YidC [Ktedonobacteraceae bacterium]|nr:membrane protein insertase YidC [Ktedonobacteraceae bacterium]
MGEIGYLFNVLFTFPIFNALVLLYHLFGDFALSIIVLTLIIKLVLFPLTLKQLKSMKATQALQPQMQEIRKKYAKDQQAQALAMQALYKEYGVNPIAGCLPLLIQLPVLYGLFYALRTGLDTNKVSAINDVLYPFVGHFTTFPNINISWFAFINSAWVVPLNHPDPTHILPILAAVATFIQLRMSQVRTAAGAPSDPTTQSMKMMQYIMPVFILFLGWSYPAGLALYWTTSTVFQAVQQYFVTGWGSLLVKPDFKLAPAAATSTGKSNNTSATRSYTNERRKEKRQVEPDDGAYEDNIVESDGSNDSGDNGNDGSIASQLRTNPRPSGTPYNRRRQRSGSASARRRSTQKSRS